MKEPLFLTLDEVLALHADQIDRYGGSPGVRDVGLLESAIGVARATFAGRYLHGTLSEMAAAYLYHVVRDHPFVDRGPCRKGGGGGVRAGTRRAGELMGPSRRRGRSRHGGSSSGMTTTPGMNTRPRAGRPLRACA